MVWFIYSLFYDVMNYYYLVIDWIDCTNVNEDIEFGTNVFP